MKTIGLLGGMSWESTVGYYRAINRITSYNVCYTKLLREYFGLPWPCWGNPEMKHPGSPNLYDTTRHVMDGGGNFRARFGVEKDGVSLLAGEGSSSKGADLNFGYPEFTDVLLKKLGWWDELTDAEKAEAEGIV